MLPCEDTAVGLSVICWVFDCVMGRNKGWPADATATGECKAPILDAPSTTDVPVGTWVCCEGCAICCLLTVLGVALVLAAVTMVTGTV